MKKTWRITNQNGETLRTETLADGQEPKLETHKPVFMADGVTMLEPGWTETAQVIEIIDETAQARDAALAMIEEIKGKAEDAVLSIIADPDRALAGLKKNRGGKLTAVETDASTTGEKLVAQIKLERDAIVKRLEAAASTDGIVLPEWALG